MGQKFRLHFPAAGDSFKLVSTNALNRGKIVPKNNLIFINPRCHNLRRWHALQRTIFLRCSSPIARTTLCHLYPGFYRIVVH